MNQTKEKKKRPFDPISIFPNNTKAARFWFFLSCFLALVCLIQPSMIIEQMKVKERIIIMDESGIFHVAPVKKFEDAKPMHDYLVSVATMALLSRGPKGADNPPLQKQIFLDKAYGEIEDFYLRESKHFSDKSIHQKVEIREIKILRTSPKTVLAHVTGQLIRVGSFQERKFTDTKEFALRLTLSRNPRMSMNGRLPLAVFDWAIKTKALSASDTSEAVQEKSND